MNTRHTIQRDLVLQAAGRLNHPTADEIYNVVTKGHPHISRGTVYRNLGLLVGQGKLHRVELPGGADHYDITLAGHYHLHCRICGKVVDADLPYREGLLAEIRETHGYVIESHDIVLRGLCSACRENPDQR